MTLIQFFAILRARWKATLAILGLTVGLVLLVSLLLPKKYAATASVVVDVKPDPVSAMLMPGANPGLMATQVAVIESDRVALRVVRNLRLAENPQVRSQWQTATEGQGSIEQWLAESLGKSLEVKPSRESNVISVTYRAPDPRFAAALANAFVQAYLDTSVELRVDPARQYSSFFDSRSKDARETLEKAQNRLSAFQKAKGIIATDERFDIENSRLNELSSQLVIVQAQTAESSSRQTQAAGGSADRMQEVLNNPVIGGLKTDLSRAQGKLEELNARYGANHPQVIEAQASIADLRRRLDAEVRRVTGGVSVSNTINKQREAEIRASLDAQRTKVLQLKAVRDEGSVLERDVDIAQKAYEQVQARLNQTSLESQTTQTNSVLLSPAEPPLGPASPRVVLYTLISVFVGALLGVVAALLLELFDRRVRGPDDVVAALGLPVLGHLPGPSAKRLFRPNRALSMQQRVLGSRTLKRVSA